MSLNLSNTVWDIVNRWNYFAKDTVGKQFVCAVDSISANIAEGFGRYTKKDKIRFYRYALASLKEAFDWNQKSKHRNLLTADQYLLILNSLEEIRKEIYFLIKYTNTKLIK